MKIGIFDSGIGTYFMLMWIMFHMGRKQKKK